MIKSQKQIRPETKIVAFGEEHGVKDLWVHQMELVKRWAQEGYKILVMLEHQINEQDEIIRWLAQGHPSKSYFEKFIHPKTAAHLLGFYRTIETLARLKSEGVAIRVSCFDMVFDPEPLGIGREETKLFREILGLKDEDEFDNARERFMISRVGQEYANIEWADKVLIPCGSMHASKTNFKLEIDGRCYEHVDTVTKWLSQRQDVTSIFFYGMSGYSRYQAPEGGLKLYPFNRPTNLLSCITDVPETGFVSTADLPEWDEKIHWTEAYDFIFFQRECVGDEIVDETLLPAK